MNFKKRIKCPCCLSSEDQKVILSKPFKDEFFGYWIELISGPLEGGYEPEVEKFINETYELSLCGKCDLVYQSHIPDESLLHDAYEKWYNQSMNLRYNLEHEQREAKMNRFLTEIASVVRFFNKPSKELKVLDFGMGWSEWSICARAMGLSPVGLELSPSKIEYASSLGFEAQRLEDQPRNSFDFINTEQVFEHLDEPSIFLKDLTELLKPGGVIKLSIPNGEGILEKLQRLDFNSPEGLKNLNPVYPIEHLNCFTSNSLLKFGESNGLRFAQIPKYSFQKNRVVMNPVLALKETLRAIKNMGVNKYQMLGGPTNKFFIKQI